MGLHYAIADRGQTNESHRAGSNHGIKGTINAQPERLKIVFTARRHHGSGISGLSIALAR